MLTLIIISLLKKSAYYENMNEELMTSPTAKKPADQKKRKTIILSIFVIIIAFLGVGTWYNSTHYNINFENSFISSCETSGGSKSKCACAYNNLKSNYTYAKAQYFEKNINAQDTQDALNSIAAACASS